MQGFIVDAFSQLRAEETQRETDSASKCFVCSLSMFELLDQAGVTFESHVEMQHNRWAYLDLAVMLVTTPHENRGTTENIFSRSLIRNSRECIPQRTCVLLERANNDEDR